MDPVNLAEFEALACERMTRQAFDYVAGGAGDERTLEENRAAFERLTLRPRVLVDVSTVDTTTTVLGQRIAFPVLVAPTAFLTLAHPDGELATARGASAAGTIMIVSTLASFKLEKVAAAAPGVKWFQLYCYKERAVTQQLVERAQQHGYAAICMTVDVPRLGRRERDLRNQLTFPPEVLPENFEDAVSLDDLPTAGDGSALHARVAALVDDALTWDDVAWLKSITTLPVVLKGILTAEDAAIAAEAGVDGIVISNHGGRQLDGTPAGIDVLPEISAAAGQRLEILVDGGIRRGTDVVKALALGARAVLLGRPSVWGLAADGEHGVARVLRILHDEVELAMALCGCPTVAHVQPALVRRR
jgi:4-hydroxymandelate oxidase